MATRAERDAERTTIGKRRIVNVLRTYTVALLRTLEQKIADAGPPGLRIDPHIITKAKAKLSEEGALTTTDKVWYHLDGDTRRRGRSTHRRARAAAPGHDGP